MDWGSFGYYELGGKGRSTFRLTEKLRRFNDAHASRTCAGLIWCCPEISAYVLDSAMSFCLYSCTYHTYPFLPEQNSRSMGMTLSS